MENLATLRKARHLKQEEIATILGVTKQAYSKYERGNREASYETLCKLSEYFNVSVDYLIGNSTNPTKLEQWTEEEIAQGVGKHPTTLSAEEWEALELFEELQQKKGAAAVKAIKAMIRAYIDQ